MNSTRAITQLLANFNFQSYFDNTLLEKALLTQAVGTPIVDSTKRTAQIGGVGVALHPLSQSPVAVRFHGGKADSMVVTLTPGQKVMTGEFKQFDWGLPFGWLGGGNVNLYVIHDKNDGDVHFPNVTSPVVFHRMRLAISAPSGAYVKNWPTGFPWPNAVAGTGSMPQQAATAFNVVPDIVMLRLRVDLSAAAPPVPATFSMVFRGVDAFDLSSASPPVLTTTDLTVHDMTFNPQSDVAGGEFPIAWIPPEVARLVGDAASISAVDFANLYRANFIDVVRYGRLM